MLKLIRGPLILSIVVAFVGRQWIATISTDSIILLCGTIMGILFLIWDVIESIKIHFRNKIRNIVETFVLDDFLKTLYDPDYGMIPGLIGSSLGASSMYGLRLDNEQKTRLIQASLWTGKEEAQSILLHAGGMKALLPESFQQWLDEGRENTMTTKRISTPPQPVATTTTTNKTNGDHLVDSILVQTAEEDTASTGSDSDSQDYSSVDASPRPSSPEESTTATPKRRGGRGRRKPQQQQKGRRASLSEENEDRPGEISIPFPSNNHGNHQMTTSTTTMVTMTSPPPGIAADPMLEMFRIVQDMILEKIRPIFASIPEDKLEILGSIATLGLGAQMIMGLLSRPQEQQPRSGRTMIGIVTALGLSGTALGAFGTILLKQTILGSIRDRSSLQLISSMILSRSFHRIKDFILTKDKRLSTTVAFLVLALVRRRKSTPSSSTVMSGRRSQDPSRPRR